jgi:hypothetical protein
MSFHNLRDKLGRFRPASKKKNTRRASVKAKPVDRPLLKPASKEKHIFNVFLLDDTGSMMSKAAATVAGFNKVLADASKASLENNIKSTEVLALFGELNHFVIKDKIKTLIPPTSEIFSTISTTTDVYYPARPHTALWWAIVQAIEWTKYKLWDMPLATKVVLTIFTDGENNDAYSYFNAARELVKAKQSEGWVINFIGAGDDVFIKQMSDSVGIFASNTMSYANTSAGASRAFDKMSRARVGYASKVAAGTDGVMGFFSND